MLISCLGPKPTGVASSTFYNAGRSRCVFPKGVWMPESDVDLVAVQEKASRHQSTRAALLNGTGTATARKRHQGDWERQPSREACPCHPTTQSLYPTEADIDRAYHPFPKDDAWKQVTLEYCAKEGRRLILGCCGCQREKMVWPRLYAEEHGIPMNIPLLILARLIRYTTCGQRLITSWASPGQLSMTCSASHVFSGLRRPARVPKLWSCNLSAVADAANSQPSPATKPRGD
jgi:hypothetical protein